MKTWFKRRFLEPLVALLKQGMTPEKLAWSIAWGCVAGVFPVIGSTTALCMVIGYAFRLNHVSLQLANYAVYPVQLALLIPLFSAGAWVFSATMPPWRASDIVALIRAGWFQAIALLWTTTWHAILVWVVIAPAAAFFLNRLFLRITQKLQRRHPAWMTGQ